MFLPILFSAGVGRTGAIIALNYLQDQAEAESKVDFYQCVARMRERRPNMVQTQVCTSYEFTQYPSL